MKSERRGLCVATSTLEVGIDIGDIDVVVLADPPTSVSSMLQRLGRGNRRSDRCVVWACSADEWEFRVINAVYDCAVRGELDDVHDYTRPSVQFQQAIGAAWVGLRRDSPLTPTNLKERTGGGGEFGCRGRHGHSPEFCVRCGARCCRPTSGVTTGMPGSFTPCLLGGGGVPLVDVHSGETTAECESRGGCTRALCTRVADCVSSTARMTAAYMSAPQQGASTSRLVRLPSARGRFRGLSRQVVWSMARSEGHDPARWTRDGPKALHLGWRRLQSPAQGNPGHNGAAEEAAS